MRCRWPAAQSSPLTDTRCLVPFPHGYERGVNRGAPSSPGGAGGGFNRSVRVVRTRHPARSIPGTTCCDRRAARAARGRLPMTCRGIRRSPTSAVSRRRGARSRRPTTGSTSASTTTLERSQTSVPRDGWGTASARARVQRARAMARHGAGARGCPGAKRVWVGAASRVGRQWRFVLPRLSAPVSSGAASGERLCWNTAHRWGAGRDAAEENPAHRSARWRVRRIAGRYRGKRLTPRRAPRGVQTFPPCGAIRRGGAAVARYLVSVP
jgi:hypothetical protein